MQRNETAALSCSHHGKDMISNDKFNVAVQIVP